MVAGVARTSVTPATPDLLNSALSNCLREKSAVYAKISAGHEAASLFARQEDRGTGELGGISETRHRCVAENQLAARGGGPVLIEKQTAVLFSWKNPGVMELTLTL